MLFDINNPSKHNEQYRFILGKEGKNKIFIIALNPHKAGPNISDNTVTRVVRISEQFGYDGFVMLNLCHLRSPEAKTLPSEIDRESLTQNINFILNTFKKEKEINLWVAWGKDIEKRDYFKSSLLTLFKKVSQLKINWLHYGLVTKDGHPRHPSRQGYNYKFSTFNINNYIKSI